MNRTNRDKLILEVWLKLKALDILSSIIDAGKPSLHYGVIQNATAIVLYIFFVGSFNQSAFASKCYGEYPCYACHTCEYCAHCNAGGKCGVCDFSKRRYEISLGNKTIVLPEHPSFVTRICQLQDISHF